MKRADLSVPCACCHHPRGRHKRGWGPCQYSRRTTVLDISGAAVSDDTEYCDCLRWGPT
jgi:hypothetical protein